MLFILGADGTSDSLSTGSIIEPDGCCFPLARVLVQHVEDSPGAVTLAAMQGVDHTLGSDR